MKEKETKKEQTVYVGIDVSKKSLDICVLLESSSKTEKVKNNKKAIELFFKRLQKQLGSYNIHVCLENTGYYNWATYEAMETLSPITLFVISPLHIKRSIGLVRGKNDAIDAERIASFLRTNQNSLKPFIIPRKIIRSLQALVAQRKRLVEMKSKISVPSNELKSFADKTLIKQIMKTSAEALKTIVSQVLVIEKQIEKLINEDPSLKEKYNQITSIQGVGKVLCWSILIKTNEFKSINDPRKLACYAGVVPFEYSSGTSIFKKPRVSVMADRTLKKLLHMAAMRAIQIQGDLQSYYQRKVAEGKNKMLVLNNVRNKIVARICSVVKNQKTYIINLNLS